jgi:hypothetical protein
VPTIHAELCELKALLCQLCGLNGTFCTVATQTPGRTIRKFVTGIEVHKNTASAIIRFLGLDYDEIVLNDLPPLSLDDAWQELERLAQPEPYRLRMVLAQLETASVDDEGVEKFLSQVPSKSSVWIEMTTEAAGHLILLDRDSTGEIVVLSPSHYIPVTEVCPGKQWFPHKSSTKRVFKPATLGDEVFIAIILSELPNFDWLKVGEKCVRLDAEEMQELLSHVKVTQPLDLIRSQVKIVAA